MIEKNKIELHKINYEPYIENMPDGFIYQKMVYDPLGKPVDFVFLKANKAFLKLIGLGEENLIGKCASDFMPSIKNSLFYLIETCAKVSKTGGSVYLERLFHEFGKWFSISIFSNELDYFGAIFQDITKQKQLEDALTTSNQLLNEAQQTANMGNWNWDMTTEKIHWSDALFQILGFEPHEVTSKVGDFTKYIHVEDVPIYRKAEELAFKGQPLDVEYRIIRKDGRIAWLRDIGQVVFDDNGKPLRFFGVTRDITADKQAEYELKKLTEEYETIFNGTQDALFLVDINDTLMTYRRLNRYYEFVSQLFTDMVVGKTPSQVYGAEIGSVMEAHYRECILKKSSIVYEETLEYPHDTRHFLTILFPILKDGEVVQLVGSSRDITQQKEALEALKESEQLYSSLFENNLSIMFIFDPENGDIIYANPAACAFYGYSRDKIKTMNILDINTVSREVFQSMVEQTTANMQTSFHFKHRLSDGSIRDVESYSGVIHINKKQCVYSIVHDITERTIAEKELQEEKERLNVTLHSIGDAVIATDADGYITLFNSVAEELIGCSKQEAMSQSLHSVFHIIHEETRIPLGNPVSQVLLTREAVEMQEALLISRKGCEKNISVTTAPIKDKEGSIFGIILVFRDITEKKQKEAEIRYLSFHDKLTDLYNRAFFEEELQRLDTERQLPLSVIIGDVNGLKLSNDVFGHQAGDKLLIKISNILKESCRGDDIIARWGGDEFAIILPNTTDEAAVAICERIKKKCTAAEADPVQPNIGLGSSTKVTANQDINMVINDAEEKMYRHKFLEGKSVRGSIIGSLKKTLFERNYETEEHTSRLIHMASRIGKKIGLSSSEQDELNLLALLHDIGKIGVSDSILMKPGKLTAEEWAEMKKHTEIGYRIAQASQELSHIADSILYHHERWDGSGYPRGLAGQEIPKISRIISIIDSYDVMTHSRPYKTPISHDEAITEIINCSGTQFDPGLVKTCVRVISEYVFDTQLT